MGDKDQDPQLQTPQDANTGKHINFREVEENDSDRSAGSGDDAEDDSPTKKAWQELREENRKS